MGHSTRETIRPHFQVTCTRSPSLLHKTLLLLVVHWLVVVTYADPEPNGNKSGYWGSGVHSELLKGGGYSGGFCEKFLDTSPVSDSARVWGRSSSRENVRQTDHNPHFPPPCITREEKVEKLEQVQAWEGVEGSCLRSGFISYYPRLICLVMKLN